MQWQCECVCECFDVALEHVLVQMNQPSLLPPFDIGHHHLATNPIDNSDIKWATTTTTATQLNVLTLYQLLNTNNHRCSPIACWYTLHISPKSPFPPFLRATIIVAEIEHCNWCNNLASFWAIVDGGITTDVCRGCYVTRPLNHPLVSRCRRSNL